MTTIIKSSGYNGPVDGLKLISDFDLFPSQKLVGLYEFLEGTGEILMDTSGNGNHGAITPGAGGWQPEAAGWSYQFDGVNTAIDLPFGTDGDLTLVVVCKPVFTGNDNAYRVLASNLTGPNKGAALCYFSLAGGGTSVVYGAAGGLGARVVSPPDVAVTEPWRMEVVSLGSNGAASLANMTAGRLSTIAIDGYVPSAGLMCIGNNRSHGPVSSARPFNGRIAAVAVYSRKLSPLPSVTSPGGPSEFTKLQRFANTQIVANRAISI